MVDVSCLNCLGAASGEWHEITDSCALCRARSIGRLKRYRDAATGGVKTAAYREMLRQAVVTHDDVVTARANDWATERKAVEA